MYLLAHNNKLKVQNGDGKDLLAIIEFELELYMFKINQKIPNSNMKNK